MSIWNKDSLSSPNSPRTLYIHQAKLDFTAILLPQPAERWGCRWERATMPRLGFISIRNVKADSQNWPSRITSNTFKIAESINTIWQTQANEDVQGWALGERGISRALIQPSNLQKSEHSLRLTEGPLPEMNLLRFLHCTWACTELWAWTRTPTQKEGIWGEKLQCHLKTERGEKNR